MFSGKSLAGKVVYGLELVALIALPVLEYLSGYKGGLMKHFYFKKMEYMFSVYSASGMLYQSVAALLLLVGSWWLMKKQGSGAYGQRCLVRMSVYAIALICAFYSSLLQDFVIYAYALMFIEALIIIEAMKIACTCMGNNSNRRAYSEPSLPLRY